MIALFLKNSAMTVVWWATCTDGGARVVDGETVAGWGVISRSPRGRIYVMFGPVITTQAHLAFSGARTHSNNTAELSAILKHWLSLVLEVLSHLMNSHVFLRIPRTLLVFVWARSWPAALTCSWHLLVSSP